MPATKLWFDEGHGGASSGAVSGGHKEKDAVLDMSNRVHAKLTDRYVVDVMRTRTEDVAVTLVDRVRAANAWGADFFFSFHSNGHKDPAVNGYEDFIFTAPSTGSIAYQDVIHRHAAAVWTKYGRANRGKKRQDFYVLRYTHMPAMLIENGFMTNARDMELLRNAAFLDELAEAITAGLAEALQLPQKAAPDDLAELRAEINSLRGELTRTQIMLTASEKQSLEYLMQLRQIQGIIQI